MCILLVWFLERVIRIETMSSIQHCHIPVEAILNGQMTLEAQHNCNQCRSIMWGVFVVSIFKNPGLIPKPEQVSFNYRSSSEKN